MQFRSILLLASSASMSFTAFAQLPPLGGEPAKPAAGAPAAGPSGKLGVDAINADLKAASTANQEKRFADAEALMLRDTAAKPDLILLWLQLGTAQLGLKKYNDAEFSFRNAI